MENKHFVRWLKFALIFVNYLSRSYSENKRECFLL